MRASRDARKRNQLSLQRTEVRGQLEVQFVFIAAELDVAVVHSHTTLALRHQAGNLTSSVFSHLIYLA